ncbi:30S ribosomal protein S6 [Brevibacterium sp. 50QC2O2]|jgi:small subunit ribosomal protein S6|uniref:30S ribosomal protein S6 n=1 Tax=Brevibacterium TaxID=1696 RepID=UPI00211BD8B0|nr:MULTISPECIES: 30S ribosomal protein S6 [unclassified Brevibacterium]MCQ9368699.1 30S ribosomal protein S6 [Brevibacterium sp. 91QC2O2]MCQ9386947.1 30S ribosomal protein S6 [Brevibacterium sp. 68QC2CO]MCQ9389939.1 30S ribosomal protein S6 [Brevibacterium sp. 50QC2O2]
MRHYELMLILDPELDERSLGTTVEKLTKVVPAENGTIDNVDIWGRRRLAYEIQKKTEGYYAVIDLHAEPATTKELERLLGLNESVLRSKFIRPAAK